MKKSLFTARDSLVWAIVFLFVTGIFAWSTLAIIRHGGFHIILTSCLVYSTFVALIVRHFIDRWRRIQVWNASAKMEPGMAYIPTYAPRMFAELFSDIEDMPMNVATLFVSQYNSLFKPRFTVDVMVDKILDYLRGGSIFFVDKQIFINGKLAGGVCQGNEITVIGPQDFSTAKQYVLPLLTDVKRTHAYLKHELGHACCFALKIPVADHHRIIKEVLGS